MISRLGGASGGGVAVHSEPWGITTTSLLGIAWEETSGTGRLGEHDQSGCLVEVLHDPSPAIVGDRRRCGR